MVRICFVILVVLCGVPNLLGGGMEPLQRDMGEVASPLITTCALKMKEEIFDGERERTREEMCSRPWISSLLREQLINPQAHQTWSDGEVLDFQIVITELFGLSRVLYFLGNNIQGPMIVRLSNSCRSFQRDPSIQFFDVLNRRASEFLLSLAFSHVLNLGFPHDPCAFSVLNTFLQDTVWAISSGFFDAYKDGLKAMYISHNAQDDWETLLQHYSNVMGIPEAS